MMRRRTATVEKSSLSSSGQKRTSRHASGFATLSSDWSEKIPYAEGEIGITVTAGITRVQQGETLDTALGRADRAMYQGKQTGRNRCMFMDENEQIALVDTNDGTSYPLSA